MRSPSQLASSGLSDLARFVIRYESHYRRRVADANAVLQGMNLVNGLDDPIPGDDPSLADWGIYLMRLGAKQFPTQTGVLPRLARMLLLFDRLPPEVPEAARYGHARPVPRADRADDRPVRLEVPSIGV